MHSPADFRVSGLEVGDPLTSYLGSGLEVRIALVLYAHQGRRCCTPFRIHSPIDFRVSGLVHIRSVQSSIPGHYLSS